MKALIIIGIVIVISLLWMFNAMRKAPEGYEDKNGFHEGKEP